MKLLPKDIAPLRAKLISEQNNRCALCGEPFLISDVPCLDHDHRTGRVRSVLHRQCNWAFGKIEHALKLMRNPDAVLHSVASYLDFHRDNQRDEIHPSYKTREENLAALRLIHLRRQRTKTTKLPRKMRLFKKGR